VNAHFKQSQAVTKFTLAGKHFRSIIVRWWWCNTWVWLWGSGP